MFSFLPLMEKRDWFYNQIFILDVYLRLFYVKPKSFVCRRCELLYSFYSVENEYISFSCCYLMELLDILFISPFSRSYRNSIGTSIHFLRQSIRRAVAIQLGHDGFPFLVAEFLDHIGVY